LSAEPATTGLRRGDFLNCGWRDVDIARGSSVRSWWTFTKVARVLSAAVCAGPELPYSAWAPRAPARSTPPQTASADEAVRAFEAGYWLRGPMRSRRPTPRFCSSSTTTAPSTWVQLRTTSLIESTSGTVAAPARHARHRCRAASLAMAFKPIQTAQARWRIVSGPRCQNSHQRSRMWHSSCFRPLREVRCASKMAARGSCGMGSQCASATSIKGLTRTHIGMDARGRCNG